MTKKNKSHVYFDARVDPKNKPNNEMAELDEVRYSSSSSSRSPSPAPRSRSRSRSSSSSYSSSSEEEGEDFIIPGYTLKKFREATADEQLSLIKKQNEKNRENKMLLSIKVYHNFFDDSVTLNY
jgi:hypothetical protein